MAKKNRVTNTVKKQQRVTTTTPNAPGTLMFDFRYENWLKGVQHKEFTNKLKNETEFAKAIYETLTKIIPIVQREWREIKISKNQYQYPHCHTLKDDKAELAKEIIRKLHGDNMLDDETLDNLWQLGTHQGIRIVGGYLQSINTMFPLFIDYHHLIYPNVKYNQPDYGKNNFCPYAQYSRKAVES